MTSSITAGPLAYFTTLAPTSSYPLQFTTGLVRSDGTPEGTFSIDPRGPATIQSQAIIRLADTLGNLVFFIAAKNSALDDRDLWRSDGTVALA